MKLNNKKMLLLGLILGLSLMLAGCLDSAPGEDSSGETKVWNTYDNASSFSIKYKSGWQTYKYKDLLGAMVNSLENNEEFQQILNNVEEKYNVNLEEEITSLDELADMVYKIEEVTTALSNLRAELLENGLQVLFTQSEIDQLMNEFNFSSKEALKDAVHWDITALWAQLSELEIILNELEEQLADSAFIAPEKLEFNFTQGETSDDATAEIANQFLFAASTVTEDELIEQGMMMPNSKEEFYYYMEYYAEEQYGNKVVSQSKFDLDQSDYAAYKIELKYDTKAKDEMGYKQTEIGIYKDGQAGFVRYQGTASGHDQYSSVAEEMAKSFQFK